MRNRFLGLKKQKVLLGKKTMNFSLFATDVALVLEGLAIRTLNPLMKIGEFEFRGHAIPLYWSDIMYTSRLLDYDIFPMLTRVNVCNERKTSQTRAFKLFLIASVLVRRIEGMRVNPYRACDKVWHMLLIHTYQYRRLCYWNCGFFVEHDPKLPAEELVRLSNKEYAQLAQIVQNWTGKSDYFSNALASNYLADDKFDDHTQWSFQAEFEQIEGITTVNEVLQ
ncbi:MAG: hypothetical protein EAZ74_04990 [Alphaproteobacteria bacterium]|nr:MAG: hypothetical protein EAY76_02945 [Alphaproteobacteria bacterium]TAF13811.1 MAG: hypothetical protein EAZ74_04990 [Alphaproteobacteria bacterium]TAF41232.1 MAG: hypothetical protein EAZ66_01735 [Alphaproteobacteria bacterium]TAF75111.1 MAG: hypothetical protein EAZ52_07430 [Alphaproteobacteria bacterium]